MALLVAWLEGLVLMVDMYGVEKYVQETSDILLRTILQWYIGASVTSILKLSSGTWSKIAYYHSVWICCWSILITLLTLNETFLFGFNAYTTFYSRTWLLHGNTWGILLLGCHNHHTGHWWPRLCPATDVQHHDIPRVGHLHIQSRLVQLPMTTCLNLGKLGNLIYSFVRSVLQFI